MQLWSKGQGFKSRFSKKDGLCCVNSFNIRFYSCSQPSRFDYWISIHRLASSNSLIHISKNKRGRLNRGLTVPLHRTKASRGKKRNQFWKRKEKTESVLRLLFLHCFVSSIESRSSSDAVSATERDHRLDIWTRKKNMASVFKMLEVHVNVKYGCPGFINKRNINTPNLT